MENWVNHLISKKNYSLLPLWNFLSPFIYHWGSSEYFSKHFFNFLTLFVLNDEVNPLNLILLQEFLDRCFFPWITSLEEWYSQINTFILYLKYLKNLFLQLFKVVLIFGSIDYHLTSKKLISNYKLMHDANQDLIASWT